MTTQALLARWHAERDPEAFRALFVQFAPMVFATARRILGNEFEAEEITQECFESLASGRHRPRGSLGAWLHRMATNRCIDRMRSADRRRLRERAFMESRPKSTTPNAEWTDIYAWVDAAIAQLPESQREALVAYFLESRSQEAIAQELGVARQTVADRVRKGIEGIRSYFDARGVSVASGVLTAGLTGASDAAPIPASLAAKLGKIALSRPASVTVQAASLVSAKAMIAALVVAAAIPVAIYAWVRGGSPTPEDVVAESVSVTPNSTEISAEPETAQMEDASSSMGVPFGIPENGGDRRDDSAGAAFESDTENVESGAMASVSGRVLLPDGRPYVGAVIHFAPVVDDDDGSRGVPPSTATDNQGAFRFTEVTSGEYSLQVTPPGAHSYGQIHELRRVEIAAGEALEGIELVYGTEGNLTIAGIVTDSAGNPLADIEVSTSREVRRTTFTDAEGRFLLEYLPAGEHVVSAEPHLQSDDRKRFTFKFTVIEAGVSDAVLILQGRGSLAGRVVRADTGRPLSTFEVGWINGHIMAYEESFFANDHEVDDANGEFRLEDIYTGDVSVLARAEGFAPAYVHAVVREHETTGDLVIALQPGSTVSGVVVDASGMPIFGATVALGEVQFAAWLRNLRTRGGPGVTATDRDGQFTLTEVPEDVSTIAAYHDDYAPSGVTFSHSPRIVLFEAARLDATVFAQNEPLPRAEVKLWYTEEARATYIGGCRTDEDGRGIADDILPGWARVTAETSERRRLEKHVYFEPGATQRLHFDFAPAVAAIEGIVTNGGVPLAEAAVTLRIETESEVEVHTDRANAEGYYRISDLPLGSVQLKVDRLGTNRRYIIRVVEFEIDRAGSLRHDIEFGPGGSLEGQVLGFDGSERVMMTVIEGRLSFDEAVDAVRLGNWDFWSRAIAECDAEGFYAQDWLEPGDYTVLAEARSLQDWNSRRHFGAKQVTIVEDETATVNFEYR